MLLICSLICCEIQLDSVMDIQRLTLEDSLVLYYIEVLKIFTISLKKIKGVTACIIGMLLISLMVVSMTIATDLSLEESKVLKTSCQLSTQLYFLLAGVLCD